MTKSQITHFTILGERNSGTHFLQYALLENFDLTYNRNTLSDKHFIGFSEPLSGDDLLTICIIRHPIVGVDSYFKRLHFVPHENRESIEKFISNEFYSLYDSGDNNGCEIMNDRNYITNERYKNIFELRKLKNDYFLNILPKKTKNYYILKYEDLRDDYENTLNKLKETFNLIPKNIGNKYKRIDKMKGTFNALYELKPILLSDEIKKIIKEKVDKEQENLIGYNDI